MKTLFFLLVLTFCGVHLSTPSFAMGRYEGTETAALRKSFSDKTKQFVFETYGMDVKHADLKDYPTHLLGDQVARKIYAARKIYLQRQPVTLGFSDNSIRVCKPAIYNAITKLETYFKKSVRRNEMNEATASVELSRCLDVAYIAYYQDDTEEFEQALKKTKSLEELLTVFHSISIKE